MARSTTVAMRFMCRLTVKLRGRAQASDWSRGCTLSSRTRGDTTALHGPLQRLLGAMVRVAPAHSSGVTQRSVGPEK
jgi:hypothetical protein